MPFKSTVGDYQTVATLETFGFLPPFTQDEIYDQIAYIIAQGWSPLIEHVHPSRSMATYWATTPTPRARVPASWCSKAADSRLAVPSCGGTSPFPAI